MRRVQLKEEKEWKMSFKYVKSQLVTISKFPESYKRSKSYLMWLEETCSTILDEWKHTKEYAQLLEELEIRKKS